MNTTPTQITCELTLNCSPQDAYALITQPEHIARWFCDVVEIQPGVMSFKWKMQDGGQSGFDVEVVEAVPGERFVYRSMDEFPTTTRFTLSVQEGGTQVTLVEELHPQTPDLEALHTEHSGGWDWFFSRLQGLA